MNSHTALRLPPSDRRNQRPHECVRASPPLELDRSHRSRMCARLTDERKGAMFGGASNRSGDEAGAQRTPSVWPLTPEGASTPVALMPPPNTILREGQVTVATGLGRSSVWAYGNPRSRYYDPTFPKPIKLGVRAVGWRANEVFLWIASRVPAA